MAYLIRRHLPSHSGLPRGLWIALIVLSACSAPPSTIPLTGTPGGPVVPTRAPTTQPTVALTATPTEAPLLPPTDTPSAANRVAPESTAEAAPALHVASGLLAGRVAGGTIDDSSPSVLYTFLGQAGDIVNVSLKARSDDLDPFLIVLDPEGRELGRADDAGDGTRDSAIRGLTLPASGVFTVVATRFLNALGETRGDFDVRYDVAESAQPFGVFSRALGYESLQDGAISDAAPEQVYTFAGNAGDVLTIQVSAVSGDWQPMVELQDAQGRLVEAGGTDSAAKTASIRRVQLPQSGSYSIVLGRTGGAGDYRLKLALDQAGEPNAARPEYAVLHPLRSFSVVGAAATTSGYFAGIRSGLDEQKQPTQFQTVLTFILPLVDSGAARQARLEFGSCLEAGGGFSALAPLDLYDDPTGAATRNPDTFRPSVGARRIAQVTSCAPVDVTETIQQAYATGTRRVQFWIVAPKAPVDGQPHSVEFVTPRLAIEAE